MPCNALEKVTDTVNSRAITRREFMYYSAGFFGTLALNPDAFGELGNDKISVKISQYPINPKVTTTLQEMISFPKTIPGLTKTEICQIEQFDKFGYGKWTPGSALPLMTRTDIMAKDYSKPSSARIIKLVNFFTFSDIHITDKEAPNQLVYFQQADIFTYNNTSVYSPVMLYSTHVLDAAIQTVNAIHKQTPFDFGISLGDTCNSTSYNELRWYIDVIDGKVIRPGSGAHLGEDTIDYQKPYQAAGLDTSIPWYQALGNHDHFFLGCFPVDANPALGLRASYLADTVWAIADILVPNQQTFPVLFNINKITAEPKFYPGILDGSTPYGTIIHAGLSTDPVFVAGAPKITADPDRRSLVRTEWVQEFFKTTTTPVGHGFHLVDKNASPGFACYSFLPNPKLPLKVIVLDDTQREDDGSTDVHVHGYLDGERWAWLQAELAKGQADNQLMIIAAHIPIGVAPIGSEMEWWDETTDIAPQHRNAVSLVDLVKTLQNSPNLLMWIAGHRHMNTVKAFPSTDPAAPEQGFWQVETASLRDFPQQFRTFEIYLNSDYTVSIVTVNVDPAVAEGTPAATSRRYAIAAQQIVQNDMHANCPNYLTAGGAGKLPVPSMDPTRPQSDASDSIDPTIKHVDLSNAAVPVPYHGSYNAELFKQLSPTMVAALKRLFPPSAS